MQVTYRSKKLEKLCTNKRLMSAQLDAQVAKKLQMRLHQLRSASHLDDLFAGTGKWHRLSGERTGQIASSLTANWRLIVEPVGDQVSILVVEIVDYH